MTNWYDPTDDDYDRHKAKQTWLQRLRDKHNQKVTDKTQQSNDNITE